MIEHLYPHMVQEYYVKNLRQVSGDRDRQREKIRTRAGVLGLKTRVQKSLRASFGELPERTPLNPRVTGRFERAAYVVEKIIFESRPGLFVTANLYVPRGKGPFPCVLGVCGHIAAGKAAPYYQAFAQGLATKGYLVLLYDPLSQGERIQYPRREGVTWPRGCCQEHNLMGKQMALVGEFFGKWRLWDGIRALDYLLAHPQADPTRVGVTGNSGGGTLASYLNAFDDRFTMAAPSCFITTYLCNLENELPADAEQIPPRIIASGLDMADFFVAQIPRPVILLGQENDFFDRRGLVKAYQELKRLYALMGAADNVKLFIGPGKHGYSVENREAMYAFFNKHAGLKTTSREGKIVAESPKQLAASPAGQIHKMAGKRVFDFTKARAAKIGRARGKVPEALLKKMICKVLALEKRPAIPRYRVLGVRANDPQQYACHSRFAVETESGIQAILHVFGRQFFHQLPAFPPVRLYIPHLSSREDVAAGAASGGNDPLFALDARGMGETTAFIRPGEKFLDCFGSDYFHASHALMFGQSYLGRRVHDLLATLDLLQGQGCREVHLLARGMGALTAVFAACLHPLVKKVTLQNALLSYHELTQVPAPGWPLSALPEDVLRYFDLPDCYRALAKKHLVLVAPWNSQMQAWDKKHLLAHARSLGVERKWIRMPGNR